MGIRRYSGFVLWGLLALTAACGPPASERLDLELMIRGYTINGAWAFRLEDRIGPIDARKLADFLVLDESLFETDRRSIHNVEPAAIAMEGNVVRGMLPSS